MQLDDKGLYDIYSLWHIPFWQTSFFYWIILSFLAFSIVLALWVTIMWWYGKKKTVVKPAWQEALDKLYQLQQKKYLSKAEGKSCYFAMTAIIKTYLIARYQYPLHSKTDQEMIHYIAKQKKQEKIADALKEIIHGSLYIKFANERAMQKTIMVHLERCCTIVHQTIPEQPKQQEESN